MKEERAIVTLPLESEVIKRVEALARTPWWETIKFLPADYPGDKSSLIKAETEEGESIGYIASDEEFPVVVHGLGLVRLPQEMVRLIVEDRFSNIITQLGYLQFNKDKGPEVQRAWEMIMNVSREIGRVIKDLGGKNFHFQSTSPPAGLQREYFSLRLSSSREEAEVFARLPEGIKDLFQLRGVWQRLGRQPEEQREETAEVSRSLSENLDPYLVQLIGLRDNQTLPQIGDDWQEYILPSINRLEEIRINLSRAGKGDFSVESYYQNPPRSQVIVL